MKKRKILILYVLLFVSLIFTGCEGFDIKEILGLNPEVEMHKICYYVEDSLYSRYYFTGVGEIVLPTEPTKENYTFDGWYFDKDEWNEKLTTITYATEGLEEDVKVYAKFDNNNVPDTMCDIVSASTFEVDGTTYSIEIDYIEKTIKVKELLAESIQNLNLEEVFSLTQNTIISVYSSSDMTSANAVAIGEIPVAEGKNTYYVMVKNIVLNFSKKYTLTFERPTM